MTFYTDMQAVADGLLAEFKQGNVTLTQVSRGAVNPASPEIPVADTLTVFELDAVVKAVEHKYINGSTITASEKMVICQSLPVTPQIGDVVTIEGKETNVIQPINIPGNDVVSIWKLIVKG